MIPTPFSAQLQQQRLRQQRNRQQLQQQHIKQEHLREQGAQQALQRQQSSGSFNNYVFKTLGRAPPPPPPRQSHLPGQGGEPAPEGERTPLDYQADFERAKEAGEDARSERSGHEAESHKSAHEHGHDREVAHRRHEVLEPYTQDVFLQPEGNSAQQQGRDGDNGSGNQSGGRQSGGDTGGQSRSSQSRRLTNRSQPTAPALDKAFQDAIEAGLANPDPSVQASSLVSVLGQVMMAGDHLGFQRQATQLAIIGKYIAMSKDNKDMVKTFATVATTKAALLAAGFDVSKQGPADRFALFFLQLLNISRPRTQSQENLTTERLADSPNWLLQRA
ncbi:hypothetical protein [Paracidovorax anthurii]|uniref:Type III secretion regulatory protein HpaA n=1 Tax=Paracidovorax anthurii TaxID=78229 RepID=A0A328Z032_9BURK|nr:hypothetical protein [Paracidovorax anthurii]RAR77822.1 type III secretion regulatory protein HpaA [Paracidovorax anthurii]